MNKALGLGWIVPSSSLISVSLSLTSDQGPTPPRPSLCKYRYFRASTTVALKQAGNATTIVRFRAVAGSVINGHF